MGKLGEMKKITLAICTNRGVRPKTVQSLLDLVNYAKDVEFQILVAERGYTVGENRNYCVVQAQKNGSEYLFFVDDDMTFPKETLERLLANGKEVIGVNSYSRCLPLSSTVGLMDEKGEYKHPERHPAFAMKIPEVPFQAFFVGAGVMLIDMKVFEKIKKPYFEFVMGKDGQIVHGEDGSFCEKFKKAGGEIWCDPTIEIGHLGEFEFKKEVNNDVPTI